MALGRPRVDWPEASAPGGGARGAGGGASGAGAEEAARHAAAALGAAWEAGWEAAASARWPGDANARARRKGGPLNLFRRPA